MPTLLEIEGLEAEKLYAQRQLAELEPSPWGTARLMWQNRLQEIEQNLERMSISRSNYASVALIFDGLPVIGATDIRLDFTSDILDRYQKIVSLTVSAFLNDELPERGPLPGADRSRLFVRDIARGSMGFILEEVAPEQQEFLPSLLKNAVEGVTERLGIFSNSADEDFYAALDEVQPRLLAAFRQFTQVLYDAKASARLLGEENHVALSIDDVGRLSRRLNEIEIIEEEESIEGTLLGILPEARRFELKFQGEYGLTIKGSISDDLALKYVADANFKERLLLQPVRARIKRIQTVRNGRMIREQLSLEALEPSES